MRRVTQNFRTNTFPGSVTIPNKTLTTLAIKYALDDRPSAAQIGSRLANILECLESKTTPSGLSLQYLQKNGLMALHDYAVGKLSFAEFSEIAQAEQNERKVATEIKCLMEGIERREVEAAQDIANNLVKERALAAKLAFERDPKNIARAKQTALKEKYGFRGFIDKTNFPRLMAILVKVEAGSRLSEEEFIWLSTTSNEYHETLLTPELKAAFHRHEAIFHAQEFARTKDTWSAINASGHFRKCAESATAESMLSQINVDRLANMKIRSALCTTYGGVKRDLGKWPEALDLGEKAHQFTPQNFRPCTLLGAVNIEIGNYDLGQSWYEKATQRGASLKSIDDELRSIFRRADKEKQDALRTHLLNIDPVRYSWTKSQKISLPPK